MSGGSQSGTGGDDVVDHENSPRATRGQGTESWAGQSRDPGPSGLFTSRLANEQTATRHVQLASDVSRDDSRLIEPAPSSTRVRGRRPGDDVDACGVVVTHGVGEMAGEFAREGSASSILHVDHPTSDVAVVGEGRHDRSSECSHVVFHGPSRPRGCHTTHSLVVLVAKNDVFRDVFATRTTN